MASSAGRNLVAEVRDSPAPGLHAQAADAIGWDALARFAAEPNPFLERWFLQPALDELDPRGQVVLLRHEYEGLLTGLLPLRRESRYYGRPIPHLASWIHANCFLGSPLVAAGLEHEFWRGLLAWADAKAGSALFLHLDCLPLDGPLHDALIAVLAEQQRLHGLVHRELRPMLRCGQSSEAFLAANLSAKERGELRRKQARLGECGNLEFHRATGSEDLDTWIAEFLALEAAGWKGTAGSAMASSSGTERLLRASLEGAARAGKLDRRTLTLGGRPIAMMSSFVTPPGAFGFKTAYDQAYARFSPGMLLQCANLDVLDSGEIAWFDSCAREGQSAIDRLWRGRRTMGKLSIAIGGTLRRALFAPLLRAELRKAAAGASA